MWRGEAEDWCGNSYGWIRILKVKVLSLSNAAQVAGSIGRYKVDGVPEAVCEYLWETQ